MRTMSCVIYALLFLAIMPVCAETAPATTRASGIRIDADNLRSINEVYPDDLANLQKLAVSGLDRPFTGQLLSLIRRCESESAEMKLNAKQIAARKEAYSALWGVADDFIRQTDDLDAKKWVVTAWHNGLNGSLAVTQILSLLTQSDSELIGKEFQALYLASENPRVIAAGTYLLADRGGPEVRQVLEKKLARVKDQKQGMYIQIALDYMTWSENGKHGSGSPALFSPPLDDGTPPIPTIKPVEPTTTPAHSSPPSAPSAAKD